jgi:DNA repair protein RecO (recombination protein O)
MPSEQTDAIVLRLVEFSETSLIVTLYTRDLGRISAIAKGARRPKSPFEGALDILSVCRIVVISKASEALDILTEAKLQRRFRAADRGLTRLYCGFYLAELLRLWSDEGSPNQELFELALQSIERIDGDGDALATVLHFELQGLRVIGNAPATQACVSCGAGVELTLPRVPFGYHLGGVLCQPCAARQRQVASLTRQAIELIAGMQQPGAAPLDRLDGSAYRELRAVLTRYIATMLGNPPRTQSLLPASWVSH